MLKSSLYISGSCLYCAFILFCIVKHNTVHFSCKSRKERKPGTIIDQEKYREPRKIEEKFTITII